MWSLRVCEQERLRLLYGGRASRSHARQHALDHRLPNPDARLPPHSTFHVPPRPRHFLWRLGRRGAPAGARHHNQSCRPGRQSRHASTASRPPCWRAASPTGDKQRDVCHLPDGSCYPHAQALQSLCRLWHLLSPSPPSPLPHLPSQRYQVRASFHCVTHRI